MECPGEILGWVWVDLGWFGSQQHPDRVAVVHRDRLVCPRCHRESGTGFEVSRVSFWGTNRGF